MRRRDLLAGGAAALAAGGLFGARQARAAWADGPKSATGLLLGDGKRAQSVLEVFMYGGLSPWESFYVVEDYGRPTDPQFPNTQWHLFADSHARVFRRNCGHEDPSAWLHDYAVDDNGMQVAMGPATMPLRNRSDIMERLRVVVLSHELEPHEAAIPYALSGHRLGNPRMAGMGAHVQRYFQERDTTARTTPFSYVLTNDTVFSTDNLLASTSVGMHPGSARPLSLTISGSDTLGQLLARDHLSDDERADVDALLAYYATEMEQRYQTLDGVALRARAATDHAFALDALANAPTLASVLGTELLRPEGHAACGESDSLDHTRVGIRAAAELLRHPTDPARYVNVIDTGMKLADGGGGYDTHFEHPETQAMNATSLLQNLVDHINEPGENDPAKIDLDETMIVLTTEFGRTPYIQLAQGTNHFPYGYVAVLIGGPIGPDEAGLVGSLGPSGAATHAVGPGELRAALLAAMGMWPFSQESFAVGDLPEVSTELDGLVWCIEHVLGVLP